MKARGRTQSGEHVIFKATYSGVPVYEFMCKGYFPHLIGAYRQGTGDETEG